LSLHIWYSREEIKTLEFKIRSLESSISVLKDQIKYLQAQNKDAEDAKEAAKKLGQQLNTLKRYLFVKIWYGCVAPCILNNNTM
jgi:septal ring factor EnvC (AmiA/AmiB activator)